MSRFSFPARTNRLRQSRWQARSSTSACLHFAQQTGWLCLHPAGSKHDRYDLRFAAARNFLRSPTSVDSTLRVKVYCVLTNDGDFAQRLTHPRFKVERNTKSPLIAPPRRIWRSDFCAAFFSMGNAPAPSTCSKFRQSDFASCSNKESIARSDACSSASDFTRKN